MQNYDIISNTLKKQSGELMKSLVAEILCVGTELLLGDIVNTNAAFLARELAEIGIEVYHQSVIGDNVNRLKEALEECFSRSDLVIMTGGLGPTYDDLTKETVAEFFGEKLIRDQESYDRMLKFFEYMGTVPTPNNVKQADMPEHGVIFRNDSGTAPGVGIEKNGKIAVMLPGPPFEMEPMYLNYVKPWLMKKTEKVIRSRVIHLVGIGESMVEYRLKGMMEKYTNPTIAPYAKLGEVQLRITAQAPTEKAALELIDPVLNEIVEDFRQYVYGVDIGNQETALLSLLKEKGMTVSTMEYDCGAALSYRFGNVNGWEETLKRSIMTADRNRLFEETGITEDISFESEDGVAVLAEGLRKRAGTDVAIVISGTADLANDSLFGVSVRGIVSGGRYSVHKRKLDTQTSRNRSVQAAIGMTIKLIKGGTDNE